MSRINIDEDINFFKTEPDYVPWRHETTWDYKGYKTPVYDCDMAQHDWNNTLITKINQMSAQIHQVSSRGGADNITIHPSLAPILEDLAYFHSNIVLDDINHIGNLSARYHVRLDYDVPPNEVRLHRDRSKEINGDYMFIPVFTEPTDNSLPEYSLKLIDMRELTLEEIEEYEQKNKGRIFITNYE